MTDFGFDLNEKDEYAAKIDYNDLGERTDVNKLKFGSKSIMMSDEELKELTRVYNNYVNENKVDIGFVFYLVEGK